jgi:hypothetical protein
MYYRLNKRFVIFDKFNSRMAASQSNRDPNLSSGSCLFLQCISGPLGAIHYNQNNSSGPSSTTQVNDLGSQKHTTHLAHAIHGPNLLHLRVGSVNSMRCPK